ncbi:pentatricopeptide repeat-containing protein 1, mitochondrial-like [Brachionichthys hirsutus]|uniref:pentatricopeptide repeat-containing protein 1, mitochondrial-like n=1 Tax=Brachionichthys hirsutus TaxID=412623 RepID=UPI00360487FE
MFTSVACSCARNGRNAFVSCTKIPLFSTFRSSSLTWARHSSGRRSYDLFAHLPSGATARYRSLSAASDGGTGPPAESDPVGRDNFGSLSTDISSRRSFRKTSPHMLDLQHEEDDQEEDAGEFSSRRAGMRRRNTPYWYFIKCKTLIKKNKLQEALDLFHRDMLQGEKLQPEELNYSVLMGGCGRAGQLKMAFKLYNDMKKRGLVATDATYTALFNACAESPSKQAGLQQALKLERELRGKDYALGTITYHALLKMHAINNHLEGCVHTLRDMLQNGHAVTRDTFHYLLMSCLKDKEAGFRLALQVWRQMLLSGIAPNLKNYNLLLRIARDCAIGDPALAAVALLRPVQKGTGEHASLSGVPNVTDVDLLERQLLVQPDPLHHGGDGEDEFHDGQDSTQLIPVAPPVLPPDDAAGFCTAPNLLDLLEGQKSSVVSLGSVVGASDRLALIGGAKGFLEKMDADGLSPDIRTLTLLADTMKLGDQLLEVLLAAAKQHKVKLDTAFFNSVIRRAAKAGDAEGAKAVLIAMRERNAEVDVQTFGCLALGCRRKEDGLQLLEDMEGAGFKPNVYVFSALIGQASRRLDYIYLTTILKRMGAMGVWPNEVIIRQLEFASQYPPNYDQHKSRNNYLVQIDGFRGYYQQWLKDMPAQSSDGEAETASPALEAVAAGGPTASQRNQREVTRSSKRRCYQVSGSGRPK